MPVHEDVVACVDSPHSLDGGHYLAALLNASVLPLICCLYLTSGYVGHYFVFETMSCSCLFTFNFLFIFVDVDILCTCGARYVFNIKFENWEI